MTKSEYARAARKKIAAQDTYEEFLSENKNADTYKNNKKKQKQGAKQHVSYDSWSEDDE